MTALHLASSSTLCIPSPKTNTLILSSSNQRLLPRLSVSSSNSKKIAESFVDLRCQTPLFRNTSLVPGLRCKIEETSFQWLNRRCPVRSSNSNSEANLNLSRQKITAIDGVEPFRGKSGAVSFIGLTHQMIEEAKLESAPFEKNGGSYFWVLGPIALILSFLLQQFIAIGISGLLRDETLLEIADLFCSEVIFYAGLAVFLLVTDHAQKPYLQFSTKRWGIITGLKGYLISDTVVNCIKVFSPPLAAYLAFEFVGLPALVSLTPFFAGCVVQVVFEGMLRKRKSSCWPLVPILFDIYRFYQLSRAGNFLGNLTSSLRQLPASPDVVQRSGALMSLMILFQFLYLVCLWSLLTFLLRLFPSRPVIENY